MDLVIWVVVLIVGIIMTLISLIYHYHYRKEDYFPLWVVVMFICSMLLIVISILGLIRSLGYMPHISEVIRYNPDWDNSVLSEQEINLHGIGNHNEGGYNVVESNIDKRGGYNFY